MSIRFSLPWLILSSVFFFNFPDDCGKNTNAKNTGTQNKGIKIMKSGSYSGQIPDAQGFLKLDIQENNQVTFFNVVTLHLPPAEIEKLETKLIESNGKTCFEKKPVTIEPCLSSITENEITLKTIPDGKEVKLKKVEN
jgi:hypothetical protein